MGETVDGIDINPTEIHAAADSVDEATASALENVTNSLAPSASAAQANPGWKSATALSECQHAWQTHLTDLVQRTSDAAENLRASAKDYQDLERRITESLEDIHWESE